MGAAIAGDLVDGRYRLVELVGQGGMGRVWRGRHERLGREVAVKEILFPEWLSADQRRMLIERTEREARVAASLNHPSIVEVYDIVDHGGAPVIVMEFIAGWSLGALVSDQGRLSPESAAEIGAVVLDALTHAHDAGVVHRDLKPDNILLAAGRAVVTDFGIARLVDAVTQLTSPGVVLGTPQYMSPEQVEGKELTAASDLWSLGATLYFAVEGHAPFAGDTLTALFAAILTQPLPPPEHAGALTPALTGLLVKDPRERGDAAWAARCLTDFRREAAMPAAGGQAPPGGHPALGDSRAQATVTSESGAAATPPSGPAAPSGHSALPDERRESLPVWRPGRRTLLLAGLGAAATAIAVPVGLDLSSSPSPGPHGTGRPRTVGASAAVTLLANADAGVLCVAFSPDGKTLASATGIGTVPLWDVATHTITATLTQPGQGANVYSVAFSPDGRTLADGDDSGVSLWDLATHAKAGTIDAHAVVFSAAFSPDGAIVASGDGWGGKALWNAASHAKTAVLSESLKGNPPSLFMAFSPDGKTLASANDDGTIALWNVATATSTAVLKPKTSASPTPAPSPSPSAAPFTGSVAFSPDGKILASANGHGPVSLWDIASMANAATFSNAGPNATCVAFSPDGTILASGNDDGTISLWNVTSHTSSAILSTSTKTVSSVAFSPGGKILASGGASLMLWKIS